MDTEMITPEKCMKKRRRINVIYYILIQPKSERSHVSYADGHLDSIRAGFFFVARRIFYSTLSSTFI